MSLAANPEYGGGRRLQVAGGCVSTRERVNEGKKGGDGEERKDEATTGRGYVGKGGVLKGERTVRRSISCRLRAVCSLVKRCVAFGIYRASSHLKLICLLAAGSYPGGLHSREVSL